MWLYAGVINPTHVEGLDTHMAGRCGEMYVVRIGVSRGAIDIQIAGLSLFV